ncbi:MAG: hypothetical protein JNK56_11330 [Myxococcales bacterium]|nr:hypothetical protein [Myxococcales bacterium]
MRILVATTLASLLCLACGDNGDMNITLTMTAADSSGADPTGSSNSNSNSNSNSGTTQEPTTAPATTPGSTTDEPTTTPLTGGPLDTGELTTGSATDTATDATGGSSSGGDDMSLMKTYGAPCGTDADCQKLLGPDGKCLKDILGVYALPGGYCSTFCQLPDQQTTYIANAPDCLMMADCVGLMGYFEGCAFQCTDNAQCPRDGYECRRMPQISNPDDPTYCLMTEDNMIPP